MKRDELITLLMQFPYNKEINDLGIELPDGKGCRLHIYSPSIVTLTWSTEDFASIAEEMEGEDWREIFDESEFENALAEMIKNHDAEHGINWETVGYYVNICRKEI